VVGGRALHLVPLRRSSAFWWKRIGRREVAQRLVGARETDVRFAASGGLSALSMNFAKQSLLIAAFAMAL